MAALIPESSNAPVAREARPRRWGRRSLLRLGAAGTGLAVAGRAATAWGGHDPTLPGPGRPPPPPAARAPPAPRVVTAHTPRARPPPPVPPHPRIPPGSSWTGRSPRWP